jgi:hypothetical protein
MIAWEPTAKGSDISKCLYLTEIKPSRKCAQQLVDWLKDNYPDCSFTEVNVDRKSYPVQNRGRYLGRVDGAEGCDDAASAADRQAVFDAARRLLAP